MIFSTIGKEFQGFFTGKGTPAKVTFQAINGECRVRMVFDNHIHERRIDATIKEEGVWDFKWDSPFIKALAKCKKDEDVIVIADGVTTVRTTVGTSKTRAIADSGEIWNPWETLDEIGYVKEGERIAKLMAFLRNSPNVNGKTRMADMVITREQGLKIIGICNIAIGFVEGMSTNFSSEVIGIDCDDVKLPSKMGFTFLLANDKWLSLKYGRDAIHIRKKTEPSRVSPDGVKAIFDKQSECTIVKKVENTPLKKALKMALSYVPKAHPYARFKYNPDYDEFGIFTEPKFDNAIEWNGQSCNCIEWGVMDSVSANIRATMSILDALGDNLTIKYTEDKILFLSDQSQDFAIIGEIV